MGAEAAAPPADKLSAFWELALDPLAIVDMTTGVFTFVNRAWERMLGFSREELTGRPFIDFVHPDDRERTSAKAAEMAGEQVDAVEFENRYRHRQGGWRWLRWNAAMGPDHMAFAVAADVTARKRAETFLRLYSEVAAAANESERLEPALARTVDVVCRMAGFAVGHAYLVDGDRLVSTGLWHLEDPDAFAAFRAATDDAGFEVDDGLVARAVGQGRPVWVPDVSGEDLFRRRDVAASAGLEVGVLVPVRSGKEVAAVLEFFATDPVDAAGEMAEVLENVGIQLGQVIERDAAVGAREDALDVERRYLSMVSHELRSPLTAIKGFADMLAARWRELPPDDIDEFLEHIGRNVGRLQHHVTTFLDTARVRSEGILPRLEQFDVSALVERAAASLGEATGDVRVTAPPGVTAVGDVHFVDQVLVNLLSNATRYGEPPIEVSVATSRPHWVEVRVRDHGPGVPEQFRPYLFKRFARADRSDEDGGTGLGLSIGRDLARAMGAELAYEPAGPGAEFVLRLPVPD